MDAGTKLGPYEVLDSIGKGGMGEVYRARDARLGRDVAIKVLPSSLAESEDALKRFEREARSVAALSHPNILNVFDIGAHDSVTYVVLELLEGETLRERLKGETLPWRKAIEIASGIADGLAAAHARGIVHRDLKPENLFITTDGVVKILDFGLARGPSEAPETPLPVDSPTMTAATRPGTVMGTIGYMSPEQLRGQPTDTRTDIFIFGCVLYEMPASDQVFVRGTAADTMRAVLTEAPPDASTVNTNIPLELSRVLTRCLEKKADERFHSARDLSFALRTILSDSGASGKAANAVPVGQARRNVFVVATALVIVIVGLSFLMSRVFAPDGSASSTAKGAAVTSLAVLPFECASGDADAAFLGEGIAESVINRMTSIDRLRVIPRNTAFLFRGRSSKLDQVARELNVQAILTGRVIRRGDRLTISVSLEDVPGTQQLWGERFDESQDNILQIEAEIADRIADALRLQLTGQQRSQLARSGTAKPAAHLAYMQGRFLRRQETAEGVRQAIAAFERAIALDSDFAAAYAGLAGVYVNSVTWSISPPEDTIPRIQAALQRALELDPADVSTLTQRARAATMIHWDWKAGQDDLRRALDLDPDYALAHHHLGHVLALLGRNDDARIEFERAAELEPLAPMHLECLGAHYVKLKQYDDAERVLNEALKWEPHYAPAYRYLAWVAERRGDVSEALRYAESAVDASDGEVLDLSVLGYYAAQSGDDSRARHLLQDLLGRQAESFVAPVEIARIHVRLAEVEKAIDILEAAVEHHSASWLPGKLVELGFEPLFGHKRFDALFARMGLKPVPPGKKTRLAILPFMDNSPEPVRWLASGLADAISTRLARINPSKLGVVGPEPTNYYAQPGRSLQDLQKDLNVSFVLRGSIQNIGNDVRITANLIRADDLTSMWTDEFKGTLEDPFALQSRVAERIIAGLPLKLSGEERDRLEGGYTAKPQAELAYMRGLYFGPWEAGGEKSLLRAASYFRQAIEIDPDYALPYCGLADTQCRLATWGTLAPLQIRSEVQDIVTRALALDDTLAEAHVSAGSAAMFLNWDWPVAEAAFERAIALDPDFAHAYLEYAHLLTIIGRYDEAARRFEQAIRLNPVNSGNVSGLGMLYAAIGRFDKAEPLLQDAFELNKNNVDAFVWLADVRQKQGRFEDAVEIMERGVRSKRHPELALRCFLGTAYAMAGRLDEAHAQLAAMHEMKNDVPGHHLWFAELYAALGETDEAFRRLDLALTAREAWLPHVRLDPGSIHFRGDPRFAELHRQMGLGHVDLSVPKPEP